MYKYVLEAGSRYLSPSSRTLIINTQRERETENKQKVQQPSRLFDLHRVWGEPKELPNFDFFFFFFYDDENQLASEIGKNPFIFLGTELFGLSNRPPHASVSFQIFLIWFSWKNNKRKSKNSSTSKQNELWRIENHYWLSTRPT